MSGGVDSSLSAALLREAGYEVTGVYMKNWSQDLPGMKCTWEEDYRDAKKVAVSLNIPLKVYDFEKAYRQKVVDYMLDGYKQGLTPNPDIMCNQEVKFKLFFDTAMEDGAEFIATGHYARIKDGHLMTAQDQNKDQTYFLYRVNPDVLDRVLMPLGEYTKPKVREMAKQRGLSTADKKDSQGICFIGEVGIKEFLVAELGPQRPGDIIDEQGQIVGRHDGSIFYTIGQRHGLNVGGGLPYYVTGKDIEKNQVYVTRDISSGKLWTEQFKIGQLHWLEKPSGQFSLKVRTRYRAPLVDCSIDVDKECATVSLSEAVRAVTPGQSAVFYDGDIVIGGGVVV